MVPNAAGTRPAHDASVNLDVAGQVSGSDGWWRVLRFGERAGDPGLPTGLAATATHNRVTLTWTAPAAAAP